MLFNWLENWQPWPWHEIYALDGFAGTGALGLEAASRGAAGVCLLEQDGQAYNALKAAISALNAHSSVKLLRADYFKFLGTPDIGPNAPKYNLVFLDPPFGKGLLAMALQAVKPYLMADALVYLESEMAWEFKEPSHASSSWKIVKKSKTGQTYQTLLQAC